MKSIALMFLLASLAQIEGGELTVSGTRFLMDDRPFPYTGLSFFNAIYNTNFNASSEARTAWLKKFHGFGINALRVWCQWDSKRGFVSQTVALVRWW